MQFSEYTKNAYKYMHFINMSTYSKNIRCKQIIPKTNTQRQMENNFFLGKFQ